MPKNAISKQFARAKMQPALLLSASATPIKKPSTKLKKIKKIQNNGKKKDNISEKNKRKTSLNRKIGKD